MEKKKNQKQLIKYLYDEGTNKTCSEISFALKISERSVRYLISQINADDKIIISSNKGYRLDDNYHALVDYQKKQDTPETADERKKYIFENLVITNKILNIDELLEKFCISYSTFNNELQLWKKGLSEYNIYLKTKNGTIFSIGKERDRQKFAMDIIKQELTKTAFSLENIQSYFQNVDLLDINAIVLEVLSKQKYYLDDYSLLTYIIHLGLRIDIAQGITAIDNTTEDIRDLELEAITIQPVVVDIVNEITEKLSVKYPHTNFTKNDIYEASLLMATRLLPKTNSTFYVQNDIRQLVGSEIVNLYDNITAEINEVYAVDISSFRFMYRFSLHIKNLIFRIKNNISLNEGQFTNIKEKYPFLFTIAVHISYMIAKYAGKSIPENEICYIALHVGAILEDKNIKGNKIVCALLVPNYHEMTQSICDRLIENFPDLFIATTATNIDQIVSSNTRHDLIITTYALQTTSIPSVTIGPLLDDSDIKQIQNRLNIIKEKIRQIEILENIENFINPEICYFRQDFKNADDLVTFMCNKLFSLGLTKPEFQQEILEHEKIASSSYNNFAIAHTLTNNDKRTFISLCVNPNGVKWGENIVNIVFIISINKKDRGKFKKIFDSLTGMMFSETFVNELLKCESYHEFQDILRRNA